MTASVTLVTAAIYRPRTGPALGGPAQRVSASSAMTERARAVIIGGGVGGCSIAYWLTRLGWSDVVLLERAQLTSGSTFHSAGLVGQLRGSQPLSRMMMNSVELYRELAAEVEQERMEQEILLMLQRSEVSEELDRLDGHIEETRRALEADEPAGRRLDFLMQEFNREANTLCSKSASTALTATGLKLKATIEQLREQVQNIE